MGIKKGVFRFVGLSLLTLMCVGVFAQKISNKGKDFWVGYGHHQYMEFPTDNSQNMTLYLSVEDLPAGVPYATVTVTIDSSGLTPALWWKRVYHITKNTVISTDNAAAFSFSPAAALANGPMPKGPTNAAASGTAPGFDCRLYSDPCPAGTGGFGLFRKKGVHITSDYDIVAYAHIYGGVSSGATMLLPTTSWGYSYTTINSKQQGGVARCYNFFYVVAKDDSTRVKITGAAAARNNGSCSFTPPIPGTPFYVNLNKGQIFQYVGEADYNTGVGVQLTGSRVESVPNANGDCKKIAVYAGSSRTSGEDVPCGSSSRDNDMQQCFPEHTWGRTYVTMPFAEASGAASITPGTLAGTTYKVVCRDTGTTIRVNGGGSVPIPYGSYYQFSSSAPNFVEANKPVMIGQFMNSGNCSGLGDPEMVYLSPIEQSIPKTGFYRNTKEAIDVNFVNIIVPAAAVNSLTIDNAPAPSFGGNAFIHNIPQYPGMKTAYKMVVKGWPAAKAQSIVKCDSGFIAITYGLGGAESYGYNAGAYFNNINGKPGQYNVNDTITNPDSIKTHNHPYIYSGSPVKMRILTSFKPTKISWVLSRSIDTNKVVIIRQGDNARNRDTIQYNPKPIDSTLVAGKWTDYKYDCPGTYILLKKQLTNAIDSIYVPVVLFDSSVAAGGSPQGCNGAQGILGDTVLLLFQVYPSPPPTFTFLAPPCNNAPVTFTGPLTAGTSPFLYNIIQWKWTFENGDTASGRTVTHILTNVGFNNIKLQITVENGGTADTTIAVFRKPLIDFIIPDKICLDPVTKTATIKAIDTTNFPTKDSCYWDFGDGTTILDKTCQPVTHTYTSAGTYTVKHTLIAAGSPCPSPDTIPKIIIVSNKRYPSFTAPVPCSDTTGIVNYSADLGSGGTGIKNYLWKFYNLPATAYDSATVKTTNYTYNTEGDYKVYLYVLDSSNCAGDTTATIPIKIKPHIYFNAVSNRCEDAAGISLTSFAGCYNATLVSGAGVFKGNGVDASGNFTPALAGAGTHRLWYVYTSGKGCSDSVYQDVTIYPKPFASFDYTKGCLPIDGVANFYNLSSIAAPGILKGFSWNFDDKNATASNPNIVDSVNPTHIFKDSGTYNIHLTDTSLDGCMDDTTITIKFNVTPQILFKALSSVCENQTNVNVDSASVINGVTGAGVYSGNGTTSAGILSPAVSGWGNQNIVYTYTSTGGCVAIDSQHILVKARPRISFTYPAGCLPPNGIVQFNDYTTIPDGQTVQSCGWTFGDPAATGSNPNTSTNCSPAHTYNYGTYTIYHIVTSSLGCSTDTTFTTTFNIAPLLYYNNISPVCENITTYSVAYAGSNNLGAAPGSGEYHGAGITNVNTGDFNPNVAGEGTHTIWYVFTATSGCIDSISQTVTVKPRPKGQFTYSPANGCLNPSGTVQFDASGITITSPATITSYNWLFKNGTNPGTGVSPSYTFKDSTYTISLNIQANNGCSFDTSLQATFNRTPDLGALAQSPVCQSAAPFALTPANVNNSVGGTGVFSSVKNAVTNSTTGMYDPAIAGYGVDTIYYIFTSTSGNCSDTASTTINILAKPQGSFTFSPSNGCLNTSGTVQFDASTITVPGSSVQSYSWTLENGAVTGVTGVNPTHNYNDMTDTIRLHVVGNNTCTLDTFRIQTFYKTPALNTVTKAPVCINRGLDTLPRPLVTNGATGYGWFKSVKNAVVDTLLGTYDPSIAGWGNDTVTYTFLSSNGICFATSIIYVTVMPKPMGVFSLSPNGTCLNTNGVVQFSAAGIQMPNGSAIQSYDWTFDNGATTGITGINPTHIYNEVTDKITVHVTGVNGCVHDTFRIETFKKTPAITALTQNPICENDNPVTFVQPSVTNGVTGTWSYSSSKNAFTDTIAGIYNPQLAGGYGVDITKYTFTSTGGCSASVSANVTIKARPRGVFTFTPNTGCLDAAGTVNFSAAGITVPLSNPQVFNWKFEGANSPVVNGINPVHYYSDGTDTIFLNVVGANGCVYDTFRVQTFNRTPDIAPLSIPNVCANSGSFSLLPYPAIINGVNGPAGVFSSYKNAVFGTTYDPSLAGYSTDTIYYHFTAFSGCDATVKKFITVFPVPQPRIQVKPNVCQDSILTFFDLTQPLPFGNIDSSIWDMGDGTALIVNPANKRVDKVYANIQPYRVFLTVKSDSGCTATDSVDVTVRPRPVANFNVATPIVCMPDGTVYFQNNTTLGSTGGTLNYSWSFGDPNANGLNPNTSGLPNPTHRYSVVGNYPVRLVVTSMPHNCVSIYDDTLHDRQPFYTKPIANIDVSKDTICENEPVWFKGDSSMGVSDRLYSYNWNFGNTIQQTNLMDSIEYKYPVAGHYKAYLTVRDSAACLSNADSVDIVVFPQPKIAPMYEIITLPNSIVQFNPTVTDTAGVRFWWTAFLPPYSLVGLSNPDTLFPTLLTTQSQVYLLHALGANGCSDTKGQSVKVLGELKVPNAFSPNGDGKNDTWKVTSLADYPGATMDIFDRYGNKMKSLSGSIIEWDGTKNGAPVPVGTYYYVIDPGQGMGKITGWVALFR